MSAASAHTLGGALGRLAPFAIDALAVVVELGRHPQQPVAQSVALLGQLSQGGIGLRRGGLGAVSLVHGVVGHADVHFVIDVGAHVFVRLVQLPPRASPTARAALSTTLIARE